MDLLMDNALEVDRRIDILVKKVCAMSEQAKFGLFVDS
jgi:hypothetical protein